MFWQVLFQEKKEIYRAIYSTLILLRKNSVSKFANFFFYTILNTAVEDIVCCRGRGAADFSAAEIIPLNLNRVMPA